MSLENAKAGERRRHIVEKAVEDEAFRARLLADPKAAIEEELGVTLPPGLAVEVHEEGADTAHLVLPPPRGALSDEQLARVAGGWGAILPPGRANAGGWF